MHFARHGEVASHRGDVALTDVGVRQSRDLGRRAAGWHRGGERIRVLHADSRRAGETAIAAHGALVDALGPMADVVAPEAQPALRNPDLYVAGSRVDMGSSPEAIAAQVAGRPVAGEIVAGLGFWRDWFASDDRIGYWVAARQPRGENADAVALRLLAWASTLRDLPGPGLRLLCVSHSPNLRAVVRHCFGEDPGEPAYTEVVTVEMPDGSDGARIRWRGQQRSLPLPA